MSLIKLAAMTIKSPFSWNDCYSGLKNSGKTFLGFNKDKKYVHFFQRNGKNSILHFTMAGPFGKMKKDYKMSDPFYGAIHEFTNKDMKRRLSKFNEIYEFASPESAKRFREQLKAFD